MEKPKESANSIQSKEELRIRRDQLQGLYSWGLQSCEAAATTQKPTWANWYNQPITPANSEDVTAFVIDNPLQLFTVSADAAITQANFGKTCGVTVTAAGSEISGQSSSELTVGTIHVTANQWRVLRTAEDPENNDIAEANCSVVVCQNLNQYLTNSLTWQ